ncbi:MAG: RNA-binding protein [Parcubacteria group bacterium Gr01-1014_38]|nr:MAG: RNA-binding protein [Parcubacteria group bacterium Gr01-1014_38]
MVLAPCSHSDTRRTSAGVQDDDLLTRVEQATKEFLVVMGMPGEVVCRDRRQDEHSCLWVEILSSESRFLIGERGATLGALEHVLRRLLRGVVGDAVRIVVDVNAYRARHADLLRRRAREAARRACATRRAVILEPMTAADRLVIHLTLASEADVMTESVGEDPERRVVVRPKDPLT